MSDQGLKIPVIVVAVRYEPCLVDPQYPTFLDIEEPRAAHLSVY